MSTNNLLLSLLANSSANPRSTSLMLKNTISNPYSSFARSNSISHAQKLVKAKKQADDQHNVSLVRLNHMLNLKVKNHYYFFFCKLEQNLKKIKNEEKKINQNTALLQNTQTIPLPEYKIEEVHIYQNKMSKDINTFCDSVTTVMSKRQVLLERQRTTYAFNYIIAFARKINALSLISTQISKHNQNKLRVAFNAFHQMEKEKMRNQILQISLKQITTKTMCKAFQMLVRYSKQTNVFVVNSDSYSLIKEEEANTANQKASRSKKIILKQKKIGIATPIGFLSNKSKVLIIQDKPLQISKNQENDRKMTPCLNLKQDIKVNCLPDLSDNCLLFGQVQVSVPYITINTAVTIENYSTEGEMDKKSCYTDRTRRKSIQLKATPKYSRQKYPSINKKELHLQNQSPLAKIDQILNRIQQLKSNKSEKSKEKKTVSINLSKQIHKTSQPSIIKYRKTTPINREEKENMPERLITQREVNSKSKSNGFGLDSATKYKSTVLQKGKEKEAPISTARKMKMEIENIINRRNKQLYRVESTQLN